MAISVWALLTLASKVLVYASVACAIGGVFASLLLAQHREALIAIKRYIIFACTIGLGASLGGFLIQVGTFADQGITGMIDSNILPVLFQASVGDALVWLSSGFILVGIAYIASFRKSKNSLAIQITLFIASIIGSLCLLIAFSQTGHLAEAGSPGKIIISLHVLAMSFWIGSLYPLWILSRQADLTATQKSMTHFGQLAAIIVSLLISCGILLACLLLKNWQEFFSSNYGQGLILKLFLVGTLLLVAARNKWLIVPNLMRAGFVNKLSRAIIIEIILA